MGLVGKIIIVLVIIIGIMLFGGIIFYNKFVLLKKKVEKEKANIDVALKKRFDLIPNLVECVKKYMDYEGSTLEKIVSLRNLYEKATSDVERETIQQNLDEQMRSIFAVAENYPELKASESFIQLQNELSEVENSLVNEREKYNESATIYNAELEIFPNNVFASILHFDAVKLFEVKEEEKQNIKLNFGM